MSATKSKKTTTSKTKKPSKMQIIDVADGETEAQAKDRHSKGLPPPKPTKKSVPEAAAEPKAKVAETKVPEKKEPKKEPKKESKAKLEGELPTQREAVFAETMQVLKESRVHFDNSHSVKEDLTEDRLEKLYERLERGFLEKKIALRDNESNKAKLADGKLLRVYVIGLVANWVKKDSRLNGMGDKK